MIVVKTIDDYIEVLKLTSLAVNKVELKESYIKKMMPNIEADFNKYLRQDYDAVYDKKTNTMSYQEKAPR
jgi:hypothetical protein